MHVRLVKDSVSTDSRRVQRGDTPDGIEITFGVKLSPQPDGVWLSFFHKALDETNAFALRSLQTRADHIRFTCRGDEVEYAFEMLKRLIAEANSCFHDPKATGSSQGLEQDEEKKSRRDQEFLERAKRLI